MKTCARKGCIELAFPGGYFDGLCGRECQNMVEEYQRGRDEERAMALSGADAYLKQAITEATEQAYAMGRDWSRVNERNRIADVLEREGKDLQLFAMLSFAARLRKGEV